MTYMGNYHGHLEIWEEEGKCHWGMPTANCYMEEEIPESLYKELLKFEESK